MYCFEVIGYTTADGECYCEDCVDDINDCQPIFANSEGEFICDDCGQILGE